MLETLEDQAHFHRNLAAVTDVLTGQTLRRVAQARGMAPSTLSRLVQRTKQLGQIACVPHGAYHRERPLHPEFQQLLRKLYTHRMRPTMMAVAEDVRLKRLAAELSEREGTLVKTPTYRQVQYFLKGIAQEAPVAEARSSLKHPPRERMSPQSFVLSIAYPAHVCQVDEHTLDQLVVAADGTPITRRVHGAVLICVKTAAILGAVLSLDALREEDYMRLVKQSLEPKDQLVALYECKHRWPCYGKPAVIFHDRGKIFTSERATQVLVDRLGSRPNRPLLTHHPRREPLKRFSPGQRASLSIVFQEPPRRPPTIVGSMTAPAKQRKQALPSMSWRSCSSRPLWMDTCRSGTPYAGRPLTPCGKRVCGRKGSRVGWDHQTT